MEETIENIMSRFNAIGDMPTVDSQFGSDSVRGIVRDNLEQFYPGLITAEEATTSLQNTLDLVLMEMN